MNQVTVSLRFRTANRCALPETRVFTGDDERAFGRWIDAQRDACGISDWKWSRQSTVQWLT